MTALAGYWSLDGRSGALPACERMLRSQQIYGPQEPATASEGLIALGQRLFGLFPDERRRQRVAAGAGTLLVADARIDDREGWPMRLALAAASSRN